jgi:hypothetical protein
MNLLKAIQTGVADTSNRDYIFVYAESYGPENIQKDPIEFDIEICSDGYPFWTSQFDYITGIESDYVSSLPVEFELAQNYPNPFNPDTIIRYTLPVTCHVNLSIYNLLGQKVATLVSEKQTAGKYQVQWDASAFASGVYFYRLRTNKGFMHTKKLILLR